MAELYLAGLEDVWRSERLIFRAIQQEDYDFLYNNIDADPITRSLATPSTLRPPRKEKPEDWFKGWKEHGFLLDVIICLRPDVGSDEKHLEPPTVSGTPSPEPKPIGMLELSSSVYGREPKNRASTFGITIAPPFQKRGYGTEAVNWP